MLMFNATFKIISVISLLSDLLVEETGENWQTLTLSQNDVSSTPGNEWDSNAQLEW